MQDDLDELCQRYQCEPFHKRLKALREEMDTSQKQLADYIRVPQSTISRLESGGDALVSTWMRVLAGVSCQLTIRAMGSGEDDRDHHDMEARRRRENRLKGLESNWDFGRRR